MTMFHRGDVLRKLREAQGWSQTTLAQKIGMNKSTVVKVEANDPSVTLDTMTRVASAFGVSMDYVSRVSAESLTGPVQPNAEYAGQDIMPTADTQKRRLLALIDSLDEAEAAILMRQVRLWLADLIKTPPPKK